MLSLVSRIMQGVQQSRALRYQAEHQRIQADAARGQANAQAALIEDSARRNALIDADNLMAAAANKRETTAAIKNKRATTGFTSEGTGDTPIRNAAQELQAEIDQMALSSSINSLNAIQTAQDTRKQGHLTAMVHELQASSLRTQAKGIQQSNIASALTGTVVAAYAGYKEYNAESDLDADYDSGKISASEYAAAKNKLSQTSPWLRAITASSIAGGIAYDFTAAFNPYTTTMTRKNPWGSLYSLAKGANPGIQRNTYSQYFTS